MRPLYAIAPLALLLALFGPPPDEANKALAGFMAHFLGHKVVRQVDSSNSDTTPSKPALAGAVVETSYSR